jgi:hypothetical protein
MKSLQSFISTRYEGQTRRNGKPVLEHLHYVANCSRDDDEYAAGLCHDIIEDGKATYQELIEQGLSERSIQIIDAMTRRPEESWRDYIERLSRDESAVHLKFRGDMWHNIDLHVHPKKLKQYLWAFWRLSPLYFRCPALTFFSPPAASLPESPTYSPKESDMPNNNAKPEKSTV